jgi:hypothetical protein
VLPALGTPYRYFKSDTMTVPERAEQGQLARLPLASGRPGTVRVVGGLVNANVQ